MPSFGFRAAERCLPVPYPARLCAALPSGGPRTAQPGRSGGQTQNPQSPPPDTERARALLMGALIVESVKR